MKGLQENTYCRNKKLIKTENFILKIKKEQMKKRYNY